MSNSYKKSNFNNSVLPIFSKLVMSVTFIVHFLSTQSFAEQNNQTQANQEKTDVEGISKEVLKEITSSKKAKDKLAHEVFNNLKVLNDLKAAVAQNTQSFFLNFINKTRGMNFDGLKSQWQKEVIGQDQGFDKFSQIVKKEQKKLSEILNNLRVHSMNFEQFLNNVKSQSEEFNNKFPLLSSDHRGFLQNKINELKILSNNTERLIRKSLNEQIKMADQLHEIFETFIRAQWSFVYDTNKVVDRIFLANDPLGDSVFMLKKNTSGIIKEIRKSSFEITEDASQSTYFLKVQFSDLCSNKESCKIEELWIEYNSALNLKLSKPLLITKQNSQDSVNKDEDISVGDRIDIQEDGVTAFTAESSLDIQPTEGSKGSVSFNESFQSDSNFVKNDGAVLNKRWLAEVEKPDKSQAGKLINVANGFAVSCQEYIQKNDEFGNIGEAILNNINQEATPFLFHDNIGDLRAAPKNICPKYFQFSQADKVDFMVYYAAAIGMAESSCNSHVKAKGPNGTLIGQWQLHLGKTHVYAGGACDKINPKIGAQNAVCGLKMLNFYTGLKKNTKKELFYSGNYWETMHYPRPGAKKVLAMIHKFPGCF